MPNFQLPPPEALLSAIPDPETVRGCLAAAIRDAALLRSLLRVAERKANYEERAVARREAAHAD